MDEQDALTIYKSILSKFGLESLASKMWELQGRGMVTPDTDKDTIGYLLRETPEYQARFPGNVQRVAAGKPELTISEYLDQERQMQAAMQGSGLPSGFYDSPDDFGKFIAGGVAPAEVKRRVDEGFRAVKEANPEVVRQMKELYNVDEGGLAAYFLDPAAATPILVRQAEAASVAAEASRRASMQLTAQEAERVAAEQMSPAAIQQAFTTIGEQQGLYQAQMMGEQAVSRQEQISAALGTSVEATQRIATRRRRRQAAFEAGGGVTETQQGVVGLRTIG